MPYVTRIHVKRCRNVRDLDIDLSLPGPDVLVPTASPEEARAFRHLILTGANGSGKSGILEGVEDGLVWTLFSGEERGKILEHNHKRRRSPMDASSAAHPGDARLNDPARRPRRSTSTWNAEPS